MFVGPQERLTKSLTPLPIWIMGEGLKSTKISFLHITVIFVFFLKVPPSRNIRDKISYIEALLRVTR